MSDNALDETKTGHRLMFASYIGATGGLHVYLSELGVTACILSGVRIAPCVFSKLGIPVLNLSERSAEGYYTQKAATGIGFVSSYSCTRSRYTPRGTGLRP